MYFNLKDKTVKISPKTRFIINNIAKKFMEKYKKKIVITSGARTPLLQARAMYKNFRAENGVEQQRRKYKRQKLFDEIATVYLTEKKTGETHCISMMAKVIEKQVSKGAYISEHLLESAFDIRTKMFKEHEISYLIEIIKGYKYLSFQDKRNSKRPHIHVQLAKGYLIA